MLETGEWAVEGNELVIRVAASATVIDMSLGADAKRLAIATASGVLGRAVKLKVSLAERSRLRSERNRRKTGPARLRMAADAAGRNKIPWFGACGKNSGRRSEP